MNDKTVKLRMVFLWVKSTIIQSRLSINPGIVLHEMNRWWTCNASANRNQHVRVREQLFFKLEENLTRLEACESNAVWKNYVYIPIEV